MWRHFFFTDGYPKLRQAMESGKRALQKYSDFWEALRWISLGFFLQITFLAKQKGIMNL